MLKQFLMRKMLASQMKQLPEAEREKIIDMVEKNPKFFEQIAAEIKGKMDGGKDQTTAAMEVMQKHQEELKKLMGNK